MVSRLELGLFSLIKKNTAIFSYLKRLISLLDCPVNSNTKKAFGLFLEVKRQNHETRHFCCNLNVIGLTEPTIVITQRQNSDYLCLHPLRSPMKKTHRLWRATNLQQTGIGNEREYTKGACEIFNLKSEGQPSKRLLICLVRNSLFEI